jgi:hypothetical protein
MIKNLRFWIRSDYSGSFVVLNPEDDELWDLAKQTRTEFDSWDVAQSWVWEHTNPKLKRVFTIMGSGTI